jgi:hypothetical protein
MGRRIVREQETRGWVSVTQCAERHGITRAAIHAAISEGRLEATRIGHAWAIREADCSAYQPVRTGRERGRRSGEVRRALIARAREADKGEE